MIRRSGRASESVDFHAEDSRVFRRRAWHVLIATYSLVLGMVETVNTEGGSVTTVQWLEDLPERPINEPMKAMPDEQLELDLSAGKVIS